MVIKKFINKLINKTNDEVNKFIRYIDEKRRKDIAKDFQSTVSFLMRKENKSKGLNYLDELKYLDRNPFVDVVEDVPTMFTKGREHKLVVRLIQTNYRIKRGGEIFLLDTDEVERCKAYEFTYLYYKFQEPDDTKIKLKFVGFGLKMNYDKNAKTKLIINV